ncbi:MAG: hypothetical protein EOO98_10095 [Pedobacter sp.]|nr:MAG: hypothetical protein EOO98_10095 [Pedobacter sp.]
MPKDGLHLVSTQLQIILLKQIITQFLNYVPDFIFAEKIDQKLKPMELLENNRLKFNPHVTLAFRDVKPEVCRQIIAAFKDRTFKRKFIVSGFSVYKHNGKRWQPFKEILFKMPAEKPKALTLFG